MSLQASIKKIQSSDKKGKKPKNEMKVDSFPLKDQDAFKNLQEMQELDQALNIMELEYSS